MDKQTFNGLVNLSNINLSNNNIQIIDELTFLDLKNLCKINLSNNSLKQINKETFKNLKKLTNVNLNSNQINEIDKDLFKSTINLEILNLNDNHLSSIPNTILKDNNKKLLEVNMSNNSITHIQLNSVSSLQQETTIDFRNNIEIFDLPFIFESLFRIIKKDKLTKELQNVVYKLSHDSNNDCFFFIVSKMNIDDFLLAFYLNKSVFKRKDLFDKTNSESFQFNLLQLKMFKFTILDFILGYKMINDTFIINFKNYIKSILKQNKLIQNLEFKLKSSHIMEIIFERNDLLLFEAFFGDLEINLDNETTECDENKFIFNHKEFYFNINFIQCFKIILHNKNEKMAIYLFKLLSYVIKKYDVPQFAIRTLGKYSYFKLEEYKQITNFNEKFLKEFLIKIFKLKWFDLIHVILDLAYDKLNNQLETKFIYLNYDYYFQNDTNISKSKELDSKYIYSNKSDDQIQVVVQQQIDLLLGLFKKSNLKCPEARSSSSIKIPKYPPTINKLSKIKFCEKCIP